MDCKYKSKLCVSGWCDVACMYCTSIQEKNCEYKKKTNADSIREMSDTELAYFLAYTLGTHVRAWQKAPAEAMKWLQQQAE